MSANRTLRRMDAQSMAGTISRRFPSSRTTTMVTETDDARLERTFVGGVEYGIRVDDATGTHWIRYGLYRAHQPQGA